MIFSACKRRNSPWERSSVSGGSIAQQPTRTYAADKRLVVAADADAHHAAAAALRLDQELGRC